MDVIIGMLGVTIWVLCGIFAAFVMRMTDEAIGPRAEEEPWIKGNPSRVNCAVWLGPISLLFAFAAMKEWCSKK